MIGVALFAVGTAAAQQNSGQPPASTVDPKACAPGERLTHNQMKPDTPVAPGETLSDKLARTDGVLCPPRTDPDIAEKPPAGGAMKVIPPPGTPGNQPEVQPK